MTTQGIRDNIANLYWSLKKDHQALWDNGIVTGKQLKTDLKLS